MSEIQMTNKTKKSYFYIDASIEEAKKYYYRIKQIFEDQTSEYSNVAMLEIGKLNVLKVYPNLITSDEIQIQINSAADEMGTLAILSIDGKEIRRELAKVKISKGLQKSAIQLHHLAAGKYILALKCDSGKVYYENIVKQ
ncbi:MAG: T9SS type A sorting domain-containing protein [Saprospiraceae bacterium]|nr:T9SS type A sorting domain-containing protein [Saprospiraceae bacterium]